ncbi:hypothetical protein AB5I41_15715 [Sphingomonas sp. MMS24-JH45]
MALAEAEERLGASIYTSGSFDRTSLGLRTPSANLAAATRLWADIAREPVFSEAELSRVKTQQLTQIAQELTSPDGLSERVLLPRVNAGTPYAKAGELAIPRRCRR